MYNSNDIYDNILEENRMFFIYSTLFRPKPVFMYIKYESN